MKRFGKLICALLVLAAAVSAVLLPAAAYGAEAAEPIRTLNDYAAEAWSLAAGMTAEVLSAGETRTAVRLAAPAGGDFAARFTGDCEGKEFMIDCTVDLTGAGEDAALRFALTGRGGSYALFTLALGQEDYDVTLSVGRETLILEHVEYGGETAGQGRIQVRLAYDRLLDLETQKYADNWNVVAGCEKWSNKQANIYTGKAADKERMARIGAILDAADKSDLSFEMTAEGFPAGCVVDLAQLNADCYYDYYLFAAPAVLSDEDVYYNRASFTWALPDVDRFPRAGFRVERYRGEELEQTYVYDNAFASSVAETELKQNTEYNYRVTAFEQVDSVMSAVACYTVSFKYEPLTVRTLEGHFWYFIVAVLGLAIVLAGIIVLYVYYFDLKKKHRRRKGN